ncbi:MAG: WYL domain-containing transcriptional regulator [Dehalococcoidia bacterium]
MPKTDRTARLIKVMNLLTQSSQGISPRDIAQKCGVDVRTTYRDLKALEDEVGLPVWEHKGKRGIESGYFLPPVSFTLPEVMNIFLAARLMAKHTQRYEPNISMTFTKLSSVIKSPLLKRQIENTAAWLEKQKKDDHYLYILSMLSKCWVKQRTARIKYLRLGGEKITERDIDPYFIEPAAEDHSSYVIAYCHYRRGLRTFKIERIRDIRMTENEYRIPADFDATSFLDYSWGIFTGGKPQKVRLRFAPEIGMLFEESVWHHSQKVKRQADGSVIVELKVLLNIEFISWVLSWGERVEVLEPESVKGEICDIAMAILSVYGLYENR